MLCRWCGSPIRHSQQAGGWLHAAPLAALRVSRRELEDIAASPPRAGQPLHRQTVLHPAQPGLCMGELSLEEVPVFALQVQMWTAAQELKGSLLRDFLSALTDVHQVVKFRVEQEAKQTSDV